MLRIATCLTLPEPDPDVAPLEAALTAARIPFRWVPWEAPDWSADEPTLIRSTWNYLHRRDEFVAWAETIPRLWNPASIVRWNSHKGYLADLAAAGVPTVPTAHIPRGTSTDILALGWDDVVVKPAVSAGSFGTQRFHDLAAASQFLTVMAVSRDMMVQPYLRSVEAHGERSLIWIDGDFTHSIRKSPRFSGEKEGITGPFPIEPDERAVAEAALALQRDKLLYARCDLARDAHDNPQVMELELIEPSLFFAQGPEAATRLVAALRRLIG